MPQPLLGLTNGEYAKRVLALSSPEKISPRGPAVMEALRGAWSISAYTGPYPPNKAYGKDRDMVLLGRLEPRVAPNHGATRTRP
jgi:hypothetical protein